MTENDMPKKKRVRSTTAQLEILTNYMAAHPRLANNEFYGPHGKAQRDRQWEGLRTTLNKYGTDKTINQWEYTWRDLKRNARIFKARSNSAQRATGNLVNLAGLSPHVLKILKTIGHESASAITGAEETADGNDEGSPPTVHEESLPAEDPVKDEETDSIRSEPAEEQQNTHREAEALDLIDGDPTEERRHGRLAMAVKDTDSEPTLRYYEVRGNTVRETRSGRRAIRRSLAQPVEEQQNTLREALELDLDLSDGDPTEERKHRVAMDDVDIRDREPTVRYYEVRGNTLQETGGGRRAALRPPAHRQNSAGPILRARRLYAAQRIQIEERRMQIEERRLKLEERIARSGERIADALEAILHCL